MQAYNITGLVWPLTGMVLLGLNGVAASAMDAPVVLPTPINAPSVSSTNLLAKKAWSASLTAGLTLTKGNTDTAIGTVLAEAQRKKGKNELRLGADLAYGENSGVRNTELYRGFSQINRLFTERLYGTMRVEGLHDGIADIRYRVVFSPGLGYYLFKGTNGFLRAEAGPGYILEHRGDEAKNYMTLRASERGEYAFSKTAKGWESVEALPQADRFSNVILNSEIGLEVGINLNWALRSYVQDSFNNEPAANRKQNDVKLVTGISYKF